MTIDIDFFTVYKIQYVYENGKYVYYQKNILWPYRALDGNGCWVAVLFSI